MNEAPNELIMTLFFIFSVTVIISMLLRLMRHSFDFTFPAKITVQEMLNEPSKKDAKSNYLILVSVSSLGLNTHYYFNPITNELDKCYPRRYCRFTSIERDSEFLKSFGGFTTARFKRVGKPVKVRKNIKYYSDYNGYFTDDRRKSIYYSDKNCKNVSLIVTRDIILNKFPEYLI